MCVASLDGTHPVAERPSAVVLEQAPKAACLVTTPA